MNSLNLVSIHALGYSRLQIGLHRHPNLQYARSARRPSMLHSTHIKIRYVMILHKICKSRSAVGCSGTRALKFRSKMFTPMRCFWCGELPRCIFAKIFSAYFVRSPVKNVTTMRCFWCGKLPRCRQLHPRVKCK